MKHSLKKAQITLFIIMGIIILVGATFFVYLRNQQSKMIESSLETTQRAPSIFDPVLDYTDQCIQDIGIVGFKKIGEHGGYIDIRDAALSERAFSLDNDPTESDAIPLGDLYVAYWWYMNSPNLCSDCTLDSMLPTLDEIEAQMNRYIERELKKCTNGFEQFKEMGFEVIEGDVKASTNITIDDVVIYIDYPLEIKRGQSELKISKFLDNLNLHFREVYELALRITVKEANEQFLEDTIVHLIGVYSGIKKELIPPLGWLDHEKSTVTWKKSEVKERLINSVLPNLMLLQVNNTRNAVRMTSPNELEQGVYDVMFLNLLNITKFDYASVNSLYDSSWPIYYAISPPVTGEILKPSVHKQDYPLGITPSTQTNTYEFYYDLSVPVLITIRDNTSLTTKGESGYTFMFGLEANIRDNKNLQEWSQGRGTFGPVDYSKISFQYNMGDQIMGNCISSNPKFMCPINGLRFSNTITCKSACSNTNCTEVSSDWACDINGQTYSTESDCKLECTSTTQQRASQTATKNIFCDESQRISGDIIINVESSEEKLEGVSINFRCGNYGQCSMGTTDNLGVYKSKFPICIGDGSVTLEKEGYLTKILPHISIGYGESKTIDAELEPLVEKGVEIVYINVTNLFRINRYIAGILNDISYQISRVENAIGSSATLTASEKGGLSSQLVTPKSQITLAKRLTKDKTYWYQIKREDVANAVKNSDNAVNAVNSLINSIQTDFPGKVTINSDVQPILQNYISEFSKIKANIQFLESSELHDQSKITMYRGNAMPIKNKEQAILSVEKIKEDDLESNLPMPQLIINESLQGVIQIIPGTYKVSIQLLDEAGLWVPQPSGGNLDYDPAQLGGVNINNVTGYWVVTKNSLGQASKIRFYFLRIDPPENFEDMNEIGAIEDYSERYRAYIEPEFLP